MSASAEFWNKIAESYAAKPVELFVGQEYLIRREIVALSESKRTESYWIKTRIYDAAGEQLKAEMLLNHACLKQSYAGYQQQSASE